MILGFKLFPFFLIHVIFHIAQSSQLPNFFNTTSYETTETQTTQFLTTKYFTTFVPAYALELNFSLNFTSSSTYDEDNITNALYVAFESVLNLPSTYITIEISKLNTTQINQTVSRYLVSVFAIMDADSHATAVHYETLLQPDPDSSSVSEFDTTLSKKLNTQTLDVSKFIFDIVTLNDDSKSKDNTATIVIWFLGVSAFVAILTLIVIMCWRHIKSNDKNKKDDINLESLLNPNDNLDKNDHDHGINDPNLMKSSMHIQEKYKPLHDDDGDHGNNKTAHKKVSPKDDKGKYFLRIDDDDDNNADHNDGKDKTKQRSQSQDEDVDNDSDENPYIMHYTDRDSNLERFN